MTIKELEKIQVADEKGQWELLTDRQDITDVMTEWRLTIEEDIDTIGCLFVRKVGICKIDQIWYCESNIPYYHKTVYQLK